jgi:phosphoribosyl 1,2-cyclic phosphodiesterase
MEIEFFGVRGSVASPGPNTANVGGNTSCVGVRLGDGQRIAFDAGTGLRRLGELMLGGGEPRELSVLLSHYHWDHIQGLPFFVPLYMRDTTVDLYGMRLPTGGVREALSQQMVAPMFPVPWGDVAATVRTHDATLGTPFSVRGATVTCAKLNHPGGVYAYRVEQHGRTVVYATDTEHYACDDPALRTLAQGADVLIYDAQYTPEEYPTKVGWGHSTFAAGASLAKAAQVGQLVLFHHDPARGDAHVAAIEARAQELFPRTIAAREGERLVLGGRLEVEILRPGQARAA